MILGGADLGTALSAPRSRAPKSRAPKIPDHGGNRGIAAARRDPCRGGVRGQAPSLWPVCNGPKTPQPARQAKPTRNISVFSIRETTGRVPP